MNYIVLDLEWNQAINAEKMVRTPINLYGEIIQIGAVKLDENYHILDTFKIMIAPKFYREMNRNVTKITKITTEDLKSGLPFPVAVENFKNWCGDDFVFLTWGPSDVGVLKDNTILHEMNTDWIPDTYNIQIIFDNQITKENRQVSLLDAVEKVGETPLEAHDALHDAKNTVCVCRHLDMEKGMAEYAILEQQTHNRAKDKLENITKKYKTKKAALQDSDLVQFHCPKCGSNISCVGFVEQNTLKYISIGKCENNDEFFVRFRFRRFKNGKYSVSRIIYEMDDENREFYLKKKAEKKTKWHKYKTKNRPMDL